MDGQPNDVYLWVLLTFWIIVPFAVNLVWFIFFVKQTRKYKYFDEMSENINYNVKWGYKWYGKPYIKKQGYGINYSQLSKEEYFNELVAKRENEQR